jgi:hypothetical protein
VNKDITVSLSKKARQRVKKLMNRTGVKDVTDLVRKALHLYDVVSGATDKGLEVWLVNPLIRQDGTDRDGSLQQVVL